MGVDLRLLPVECLNGDWGFSHTVLNVPRVDSALWDAIAATNPQRVPTAIKISSWCARRSDDEKREIWNERDRLKARVAQLEGSR